MTITGAIVLYAVIWFMTLFVVLPIGYRSQEEAGEVEPGTPASAPSNLRVKSKLMWATLVGTAIWAAVCGVILSGWISVADLDWTRQWRE
ncbi:MAG: DUF1467 family protein [Rubricella sp.]